MKTKLCKFCGNQFTPKSAKGVYCKPMCGQNASKRRRAFNIPGRCRELATGARNRAKAKSIPYNIDGEYILSLWEEQNGCCAVLGLPFNLSYSEELQKGWSKKDAPSLDRIVPEKGYTKGNIRLVWYQVNIAKGVYTDKEFYDMCYKALENLRKEATNG